MPDLPTWTSGFKRLPGGQRLGRQQDRPTRAQVAILGVEEGLIKRSEFVLHGHDPPVRSRSSRLIP